MIIVLTTRTNRRLHSPSPTPQLSLLINTVPTPFNKEQIVIIFLLSCRLAHYFSLTVLVHSIRLRYSTVNVHSILFIYCISFYIYIYTMYLVQFCGDEGDGVTGRCHFDQTAVHRVSHWRGLVHSMEQVAEPNLKK